MGSYEEYMVEAEYEAEQKAKADYEAQLEGEAMAMQEQQEHEALAQYEQELKERKENALKLIEKADWETIRQIVGFLFDEQHLRAMAWNHIDMIIKRIEFKTDDKAEKELNDFCDFFGIWCDRCEKFYSKNHSCFEKSELSKKYDEMFEKDIKDIKKKDFIEIDEEKEMKADLKRKEPDTRVEQ